MNKTIQALYLNALSQTGNHTDAFAYIEEQLTSNQAYYLGAFIGFLGDNNAPLGRATFPEKLKEFNRIPTKEYPLFHHTFSKMAKAEHEAVFAKAASFASECLKPGSDIQLHRVCYPLENCTVISYDPKTKQVVLQLK